MRIVDVVQGTPEWLAHRVGKVTATGIAKITARSAGGKAPGETHKKYLEQKVAEVLTGQPCDDVPKTAAIRRGNDLEDTGLERYVFETGFELSRPGIVLHPTIEGAQCSPDGVVVGSHIVQIKCPNSTTHMAYMMGGALPKTYREQVQWEMVCCGVEACDFVSFDDRFLDPEMQIFINRIDLDRKLAPKIEDQVSEFIEKIQGRVGEVHAKHAGGGTPILIDNWGDGEEGEPPTV